MAGFFSEVTAKLGVDITAFKRGMTEAQAVAGQAAGGIAKKFEARDLGRTLATALGLNLQTIADKLVTPFRESAESAERIAKYSDEAAAATERLLNARKSDLQQLAEMERKLAKLVGSKADAGKGGFFEELIRPFMNPLSGGPLAGLAAVLDTSSERQAEAEAKRARDLAVLNEQVATKKREIEKKNYDEALRAEAERLDAIRKQSEAVRDLAQFEREQRREKMSGEKLIVDLRKEERDITKAIADFEKFRKEGGEFTADGARELIDLKKQQAALQQRIADETERAAKAEMKAVEAAQEQQKILASIAGIRGGRQFNDATDAALMDVLRRNENAIMSMGQLRNIGQDLEVARLQSEIQNIRQELSFRSDLRRDVSVLGVEGARARFQGDPLQFDRIVQQLVQDNRDTREILADTNRQLQQLTDGKRSLPVVVLNQRPGGG